MDGQLLGKIGPFLGGVWENLPYILGFIVVLMLARVIDVWGTKFRALKEEQRKLLEAEEAAEGHMEPE